MAYTSNKKPGQLDAVTSVAGQNDIVVNQGGAVKRATLNQVQDFIFGSKTQVGPQNGDVVVVRRGSNIRQMVVENMLPTGSVTNTMLGGSITDDKLNTIDAPGKVTNQAVQAVATNTANRIVARDNNGNFAAGTITATLFSGALSGNATSATTATTATTANTVVDGAITDAKVSSAAGNRIAGTKITPSFGSQNIVTTGSVGVGTTSPQSTVEIVGTGNPLRFSGTGPNTTGGIEFFNSVDKRAEIAVGAGAGNIVIHADPDNVAASSRVSLSVDGAEAVRVVDGGNVGIGTNSPSERLDVSGTVKATNFSGPLTGNASTATNLSSNRTFAVTGDVTGSTNSNLSSGVSVATTLANSGVSAGTYNNNAAQVRPFTVDAKGRVTNVGAAVPIALDYSVISGTPYKNNVRLATTANLTAAYNNGSSGVGATLTNTGIIGALSIDGTAVTLNDRILVKDQTTAAQNGIYTVTNIGSGVAWVLTRATDADQNTELGGAVVTVDRGTANGGKFFTTDFRSNNAIGTVAQNWSQVVTTGDTATVSETMLASNSVTTAKISNDSVTDAKLASGIDASKLTTGTLPIARIANDSVTNAKLASGIDASKLTTGTLPIARIANDSVTNAKLSLVANAGEIKKALNTTTAAPIFACRAWVNFDGVPSTPVINASGNVTSVTKNANGLYTVTFTTALEDTAYCTLVTGRKSTTGSAIGMIAAGGTSSTTQIQVRFADASGNPTNVDIGCVAIFR